MTLIEALDELRFVDQTLPVGAPPILQALAEWWLKRPDDLRALYAAAGLPGPIDRTAASVVLVQDARPPRRIRRTLKPRPKPGQDDVMRVLALGVPVTLEEIGQRTGRTKNTIVQIMMRLRQVHAERMVRTFKGQTAFYCLRDNERTM